MYGEECAFMSEKDVAVFGTGEPGKNAAYFLEKLGFHVLFFCDDNSEMRDSFWCGKPVLSSSAVTGDIPVFIASHSGKKIREMLVGRGITNLINPLVHQRLTEARPKVLEITTKIGCRVNCRFCCQDTIIRAYSQAGKHFVMRLDDFKHCADKVPADVVMHFCGLSEPFLNERCADMMLYAHKNGHDCWFASTLVNMNAGDCEAIGDIPFKVILVHLPDEEGNSHIPVTDDYKNILNTVIVMMKKCSGIKIFHCHGKIHHEILDIVQESGISVNYNIHDRAGHERDETLKCRYIYGDIYCHHNGWIFQYNMLIPDGRVVLCHCDCTMRYVLGNLLNNNYESILTSSVIEELISGSKTHDSEILCRKCQDARCVNGDNFAVWEVEKWEPYIWMRHGIGMH
jgi:hypothetical protein